MQTVTAVCQRLIASIAGLLHSELPSLPSVCLTPNNRTDFRIYLTISHTTRSIIYRREGEGCTTDFSFGCTSFRLSINRRIMNKDLSYCIVLSQEQLSYLAGSKYGIDRMKILNRLIEASVLEQTEYSKKGFATTLQVGQAALSEVELSCNWATTRKPSHV